MIVLLCPDPPSHDDLSALLAAAAQPVIVGQSWDHLPRRTRACAHACVCVHPIIMRETEQRIRDLHRVAPALPIVLLTSFTRENGRRAARLPVDDAIWLEDASQELIPAIRAATAEASSNERFAQIIEEDTRGLDAHYHGVLIDVCRSAPPTPTVAELARRLFLTESKARRGCDRSSSTGQPC